MKGAGWGSFFLGLLLAWLALGWNAPAAAHPMPESVVWIDTTPSGMNLTLQLPLNRLEFGFGKTLTDQPDTVLARYGDELAAYLLQHVGARSEEGGWQVLRPRLQVLNIGGFPELQASFTVQAPAGASTRRPELLYDVITHEVRTHRAQVFLRTDWAGGYVGKAPVLLGELRYGQNSLFIPLDRQRSGAGFASLFEEGMVHIAEGTDHLLFLLMLLVVAPLAAQAGRWREMRPLPQVLRHTAWVLTAFTAGHTATLVLGSLGLVNVPSQPVEIAVAVTIAIAGLHTWRPLFAGAETLMALCFGLIHGLAFSASLSGAGLTPWQHAQALLAFNLGIETMQLVAMAAVLPPVLVLGRLQAAWYAHLRHLLAVLASVLAALWVLERSGAIDLAAVSWLGDGGTLPFLLVLLIWMLAVGCAATRLARPARG
ncbi:HupE/UreJ family protein [Massilia sp. 9I]|uniref:HupE/UreJ family protein n=1 Tax=Massilia sp. 9I TaxID=2653152 RepID=UPI001E6521FA|nr:HupE/UreJ family protein [Massilia sp. 9I]